MGNKIKNLTDFQDKCGFALSTVLKSRNLNLVNRRLDGKKEIYIYGEVKDLEIWIYKDGAEIGGKNIDKRFEKDDFKTEDELISAFKREIESLLS